MKKIPLIVSVLAVVAALAADFEKSGWRSQLYLQVSPHDPLTFQGSNAEYPSVSFEKGGVPITGGLLWNPLITPWFKLDLPFTFWIGGELGSFRTADLGHIVQGTDTTESMAYTAYLPAGVAGISVNLYGNWDLRLLGGFGRQHFTFENKLHNDTYTTHVKQAFAAGTLEYRIAEIADGVDFKVGVHVRKHFLKMENVRAVRDYPTQVDAINPQLDNLVFDKIAADLPVQIGIELSLDFGRESRRDRQVRFQLRDRTQQLREHNQPRDTLNDWDCMAIERDYKFFADGGTLPDVRHKFTRTQYADVLESFLAFCKPENLRTRELLFASLDSNKVELKRYQVSQEDARFRQVMASNDIAMMKMFLQYYPQSRYRTNVESKIGVLEDYGDYRDARNANTFQSYLGYLARASGNYRREAETGIFALVKAGNRVKDYEIYLKRFPDGLFVEEARRALHELNRASY